jgi:hypothetical protein
MVLLAIPEALPNLKYHSGAVTSAAQNLILALAEFSRSHAEHSGLIDIEGNYC